MKQMENKKMNFNLDAETADKFKIYCIRNKKSMSKLFREMILKAIELDIYVDLTKRDNEK